MRTPSYHYPRASCSAAAPHRTRPHARGAKRSRRSGDLSRPWAMRALHPVSLAAPEYRHQNAGASPRASGDRYFGHLEYPSHPTPRGSGCLYQHTQNCSHWATHSTWLQLPWPGAECAQRPNTLSLHQPLRLRQTAGHTPYRSCQFFVRCWHLNNTRGTIAGTIWSPCGGR